MLMAAEERKPRVNAVICNTMNQDGSRCVGVCIAYKSHPLVTYYRCECCLRTKKVTRPRAG
jgi:hypothetical protein